MPCEESLRGLTSRQGQLFCLRCGAQVLLTPVGHIARSVIGWVIGQHHSHATYDLSTRGGQYAQSSLIIITSVALIIVAWFDCTGRYGVTHVRARRFVIGLY